MEAGEQVAGANGRARLRQAIEADIVVEFGFFGEPAAAEIANELAEKAGVAAVHVTAGGYLCVERCGRGGVALEFGVIGIEVGALGFEHLLPLLEWCW